MMMNSPHPRIQLKRYRILKDQELSWQETEFTEKNVLILGNEEKGIRKLVEKNCDQVLKINKYGQTSSLNVAVATAIALFEVQKKLRY